MSRNLRAPLLVAAALLTCQFGMAATADPEAASMWINGGSINDAARAEQVLDGVTADANGRGLAAHYVRTVFTDQIGATEGVEYTRFGEWKFDPSTAPTVAPGLSESRSMIDGFTATMVDEIALQPNSLDRTRSALCPCAVVGDAVLLPAHLSSRDSRRSASTLPPV